MLKKCTYLLRKPKKRRKKKISKERKRKNKLRKNLIEHMKFLLLEIEKSSYRSIVLAKWSLVIKHYFLEVKTQLCSPAELHQTILVSTFPDF